MRYAILVAVVVLTAITLYTGLTPTALAAECETMGCISCSDGSGCCWSCTGGRCGGGICYPNGGSHCGCGFEHS